MAFRIPRVDGKDVSDSAGCRLDIACIEKLRCRGELDIELTLTLGDGTFRPFDSALGACVLSLEEENACPDVYRLLVHSQRIEIFALAKQFVVFRWFLCGAYFGLGDAGRDGFGGGFAILAELSLFSIQVRSAFASPGVSRNILPNEAEW